MQMANVTVLSPVGELRAATAAIPAPPRALQGLTAGFLDNTKHNFDRLVDGIGHAQKERFGVARVVHARKANAASPSAPDILPAPAEEGDLVFTGAACLRSCTSVSLH